MNIQGSKGNPLNNLGCRKTPLIFRTVGEFLWLFQGCRDLQWIFMITGLQRKSSEYSSLNLKRNSKEYSGFQRNLWGFFLMQFILPFCWWPWALPPWRRCSRSSSWRSRPPPSCWRGWSSPLSRSVTSSPQECLAEIKLDYHLHLIWSLLIVKHINHYKI